MILVTGGTGLVGAQLLFDLAKAGKRIRALKRPASNLYVLNLVFSENKKLLDGIEWIEGDITDLFAVSNAMEGVDEIYHCAAKVSFQAGDYRALMRVNVDGTANLVNIALDNGVKKFCHVSSLAALGREKENEVIDETAVWKTSGNDSNYAISKYGSEREVWRGMEEGLNAVIVNPTIIIGPGDWKSGSSQMFAQVWKGLKFYTEGITGFVDVRDVSKCMIELMDRNIFGQRFIINSENMTYHELINIIADALGKKRPSIYATGFLRALAWRAEAFRKRLTGKPPLITKETARSGQHRWYPSNEKIRKQLGTEFISVKDAIERTAKIFLAARNQ